MPSSADDMVARVRAVFDGFDGEWERLRKDIPGRVSFEIHRRFLDQYLTPGARGVEIGAGPGIFTHYLAGRGAQGTVTDLSPVQLVENRRRMSAARLAGAGAECAGSE